MRKLLFVITLCLLTISCDINNNLKYDCHCGEVIGLGIIDNRYPRTYWIKVKNYCSENDLIIETESNELANIYLQITESTYCTPDKSNW
jgi:hypothetical protein